MDFDEKKESVDYLSSAKLAEYEYEIFKFQMLSKSAEMNKINYCDLDSVINALTFQNLCQDVREQCPLLTQIFEVFVHHEEDLQIKTAVEKLQRVVHMNACLLRIGSQASSSFPHFFGILMISFGCGQGEVIVYIKSSFFIWI